MGEKIKKDNKLVWTAFLDKRLGGVLVGRSGWLSGHTHKHTRTQANSDFPGSQSGKVYLFVFTGASKSNVHLMTFTHSSSHLFVSSFFSYFKVLR